MERDTYMRVVLTIIAICLVKIAFLSPPPDSHAQFPFMNAGDKLIDVNIKSIDNSELVFARDGELYLGGKKGLRLTENGAWIIKVKDENK
jgi:hypothetical protein